MVLVQAVVPQVAHRKAARVVRAADRRVAPPAALRAAARSRRLDCQVWAAQQVRSVFLLHRPAAQRAVVAAQVDRRVPTVRLQVAAAAPVAQAKVFSRAPAVERADPKADRRAVVERLADKPARTVVPRAAGQQALRAVEHRVVEVQLAQRAVEHKVVEVQPEAVRMVVAWPEPAEAQAVVVVFRMSVDRPAEHPVAELPAVATVQMVVPAAAGP